MTSISVVICTFNRKDYLRSALESLAVQTLPATDFEIIVVDNASTDGTREFVLEMIAQMRNLRYAREDCIGLSRARNTGAKAASSSHIAYLDDDARAEPGWLECTLEAFNKAVPPPAAVGGPVFLDWQGDPPSWLPRRYWSVYTYVDHGQVERFLDASEYLVGANMAFRRSTLIDMGGFEVRLGRAGSSLLSGEEAEVLARLRDKELPIYYVPRAVVHHSVSCERKNKKWLFSRMFWDGASQPFLDYGAKEPFNFYAQQVRCDMRAITRFLLTSVRLSARSRDQRLESVLVLLQRAGRLRTNVRLMVEASYRHPR